MILFWTMAGVPFSYAHAILYIANHEPSQYQWPWWFVIALLIPYLGVYYVWDTCNSQKNQFRQEERGVVDERTTFPYFKKGKIQNPRTIETSYGKKLLCDGWCKKAIFDSRVYLAPPLLIIDRWQSAQDSLLVRHLLCYQLGSHHRLCIAISMVLSCFLHHHDHAPRIT